MKGWIFLGAELIDREGDAQRNNGRKVKCLMQNIIRCKEIKIGGDDPKYLKKKNLDYMWIKVWGL